MINHANTYIICSTHEVALVFDVTEVVVAAETPVFVHTGPAGTKLHHAIGQIQIMSEANLGIL
jgi:hypothetical protein